MNLSKKIIISLFILLLILAPLSVFTQSKKADTSKSSYQILEERVKQNEDDQKQQDENHKRELDKIVENYKSDIEEVQEYLENRMDLYVWGVTVGILIISSIISIVGGKTIIGLIKQQINTNTKELFDKLEIKIQNQSDEVIQQVLNQKVKEYQVKINEIDKMGEDYKNKIKHIIEQVEKLDLKKDKIKPETREELDDVQEKLEKIKKEENYTSKEWYIKAISEAEKGNVSNAIKYYTNAIEINPNKASFYNNRGILYTDSKMYNEAIADFNKAISIISDNSLYYNNRGLLNKSCKNYIEALNDFNRAIELDPKNPDYLIKRATIYNFLKRFEEADEDYKQALHYDPSNTLNLLDYIEYLIIRDKYHEAEKQLNIIQPIIKEKMDMCIYYFLKIIINLTLQKNISECKDKLEQLLKEDIEIKWSFNQIEKWLHGTELINRNKRLISDTIISLKTKKENC
jgi:tetratricopeptide (TPR) repeat protein